MVDFLKRRTELKNKFSLYVRVSRENARQSAGVRKHKHVYGYCSRIRGRGRRSSRKGGLAGCRSSYLALFLSLSHSIQWYPPQNFRNCFRCTYPIRPPRQRLAAEEGYYSPAVSPRGQTHLSLAALLGRRRLDLTASGRLSRRPIGPSSPRPSPLFSPQPAEERS